MHQWLTDQSAESGPEPVRAVHKGKQTERGYYLCPQKKRRQWYTEIPKATVAAVEGLQTMDAEPVRSEDKVEAEQLGIVLKQHTETSSDTVATLNSGPEPIRPLHKRKQTERGWEYYLCTQKKGGQWRAEMPSATVKVGLGNNSTVVCSLRYMPRVSEPWVRV